MDDHPEWDSPPNEQQTSEPGVSAAISAAVSSGLGNLPSNPPEDAEPAEAEVVVYPDEPAPEPAPEPGPVPQPEPVPVPAPDPPPQIPVLTGELRPTLAVGQRSAQLALMVRSSVSRKMQS